LISHVFREENSFAPPGLSEQATVQGTPAGGGADLPVVPGYDVLEELGRGGMGVVYRAWQLRPHRVVALKMILAGDHAGPEALARFEVEAEAVARLQHPHIVQVHAVGEHAGRPYVVLECVDGGSLERRLTGAPQPARWAAELVERLARAMHHAHGQGIVHRDLKPANVLLTADGTPKVTDFGLAKLLAGAAGVQTQSGAILGTPSYMAPEQAGGKSKEIGPATDVYALGAILYELLTGRPPFRGETPLDTLHQVQGVDPVPPSRLQPRVPRDLTTICLKCLQKERPKRYPTAEALADDLQRFLDGCPIQARPSPVWERAWKWAQRRPLVAGLGTLIVLITVLGILGLSISMVAVTDALRKEQDALNKARLNAKREQQVSEFLINLFEVSNPIELKDLALRTSGEPGRSLTARDILDRGSQRIKHELKDQPIVRATLMDTIGNAYRNLGLHAKAGPLLHEALELRCQTPDVEPLDKVASFHSVGRWYHDLGDYDAAEPRYQEALKILETQPGDHDLVRARVLFDQAWLHAERQDYDEGAACFQEVIDIRQRRLGDAHRETANARLAKAALLFDQRQYVKAMRLGMDAISVLHRETPGQDLADGLRLFVVAGAFREWRQYDLAVASLKQCHTIAASLLGPDHPYVSVALYELAATFEEKGDDVSAEWHYWQCLEILRARTMFQHPRARMLFRRLAMLLGRAGRYAEGEERYEDFCEQQRQRLGNEHTLVADALIDYAQFVACYGPAEQARRADDLVQEAWKVWSKTRAHRPSGFPERIHGPPRSLAKARERVRAGLTRFSTDSRRYLAADDRGTVRVWDVATGQLLGELTGPRGGVEHAVFTPDGRQVLAGGKDQSIWLWDVATGREVLRLEGHAGPVWGGDWLLAVRQLVASAAGQTLRTGDGETGQELAQRKFGLLLTGERSVAVRPGGREFLCLQRDLTLRLRDGENGKELRRFTVAVTPRGVSISPDGRFAACGSDLGLVYLFRLPAPAPNDAQ
jgi:tetratricopeptide (TPR) repeat protein